MKVLSSGNSPRFKRAFTLVELLVVVAIIAVLAAILFPVFARARENARRSACLSNMKQIGLGLLQYLQDYDETFPLQFGSNNFYWNAVAAKDPKTGFWSDNVSNNSSTKPSYAGQNFPYEIKPYVNSTLVYTCPSAVIIEDLKRNSFNSNSIGCPNAISCWAPTPQSSISYAINGVVVRNSFNLSGNVAQSALKVAAVINTSGIVLLQELSSAGNNATFRPRFNQSNSKYEQWRAFGDIYNGPSEWLSNNHFGGGNILFVDGHAKWRGYASLRSTDFGLTCPAGQDVYGSTTPTDCTANF